MSERGSFCTEYIYCKQCFEAATAVLLERTKYLCSTTIPCYPTAAGDHLERELPIVAGKIGGLYGAEELDIFRYKLIPALQRILCHPIRIAVLPDVGEGEIFTAKPSGD